MSHESGGPPAADVDSDDPLAGPKPGSARPIVGGLLLLLISASLRAIDEPLALLLAVLLAMGGAFLTLGGLFFLLSNVDEALRTHLLRQRAPSRHDD